MPFCQNIKSLFFFLFIIFSFFAHGSDISGTIKNENSEPLAYAAVYVKNSSYGVVANLYGVYFLELKPGKYMLVFSYMGYETYETEVMIADGQHVKLNVVMRAKTIAAKEVEIIAYKKDKAKEIMKNVRGMRKFYLGKVETYSCKTYLITSLEKEWKIIQSDSLIILKADSAYKNSGIYDSSVIPRVNNISEYFKKEKINLLESWSDIYFKIPGSYREVVLACHDYSEKRNPMERTISVGFHYGENEITPQQRSEENPYLIYKNIFSCDFNFYKNEIDFPSVCQRPLLSPLAATAPLSYSYSYLGVFPENGIQIHKIGIEPVFKSEALFSGVIYIEDSTWALKSVDLKINRDAMQFCREFHIIQDYDEVSDSVYLPVRREFIYTIRDGKFNILGNTRIDHSEYQVNIPLPSKLFTNEIIRYDENAWDRDSAFWQKNRPISLKESEQKFISKSDSIANYYTSDAFYHKSDSAFNHIGWWNILLGVGHRNRKLGTEFYIYGVLGQVNPLGIGGYRHKLPGYFNIEFKNDYLLETNGFLDYGFNNQDLKGKIGLGLTYFPVKFIRTFIRYGDYYEWINNYASLEQVFSRSNYVHTKNISLSQRMEIFNGLYGEVTFEYSDQKPITGLKMDKWSEIIFDTLNTPVDFSRYIKSEIRLELLYRIGQKYVIKHNKKIIIGTDYPEISLLYRKGIPNLFNSEVNFDYLEIGARDDLPVARLGTSMFSINAGIFISKSGLRLLEHKYFRGSDHYLFSDPLRSFQLLGPTMSTANSFLRANYIHHFNGTLLNKVPLINKLKIDLAAGTGTLIIPDEDFFHFEMFAGLEKIFRIKKQLWRFGIYAVTADNSIDPADFTVKFGLDFFNTFTNKWSY